MKWQSTKRLLFGLKYYWDIVDGYSLSEPVPSLRRKKDIKMIPLALTVWRNATTYG
jgi:hypothetical protein